MLLIDDFKRCDLLVQHFEFEPQKVMQNIFLKIIFFLSFFISIFPQWSNNPAENTKLVQSVIDPVNILTAEDKSEGFFIIWQDKKNKNSNDIFFLFINTDSKPAFRADGKQVGNNHFVKSNPVISNVVNQSLIVMWEQSEFKTYPVINAQKVNSRGQLLWKMEGNIISDGSKDIVDFAAAINSNGDHLIALIERNIPAGGIYKIVIKNEAGEELNSFLSSSKQKRNLSVIPLKDNSFFLLWLETIGKTKSIMAIKVNNSGEVLAGPENISAGSKNDVLMYRAILFDEGIHVVWQNQGKVKSIYHQLIGKNCSPMWSIGGLPVTSIQGSHSNPVSIATADSMLIVGWVNELNKVRNVFLQKFDSNGKAKWSEKGNSFKRYPDDQFGQTLISDNQGGVLAAWFHKERSASKILAQRYSYAGSIMWDSIGTPLAINDVSEKSYLSLVSDKSGGLIGIFKEKRDNDIGIYGHRIFSNNTYVSQISSFTITSTADSVMINWQTINEEGIDFYEIQRIGIEDKNSEWITVGIISANKNNKKNNYRLIDIPENNGTYYYRVRQVSTNEGEFITAPIRFNYLYAASEELFVGQNSPNPFSDFTIIPFNLPYKMRVKFEIYNSKLETVKEFVVDNTKDGMNRFRFNASGLSPGVYFYRFTAGSFVEVKKMVIVP